MWRIAMTWNWELHGGGSEPVVTIRNKHSLPSYFKVPRVPRVPKVPGFWLMTYSHMLRPNPQGYPKRPWEVFATLPPHWRPWRHGERPRNGRSRLPQWPFGLTLPKVHGEAREQRCLRSIEISGLGDPGRPGSFGLISGVSALKRRRTSRFHEISIAMIWSIAMASVCAKVEDGENYKTDI